VLNVRITHKVACISAAEEMDNGGLEKNEEMENRLKNGFQNFPGKTNLQKTSSLKH
jgi:hypothetical protein